MSDSKENLEDTGLATTEKLIYREWCSNGSKPSEGDCHYGTNYPVSIGVDGKVWGYRPSRLGKETCPNCGADMNRETDPEGFVSDVLAPITDDNPSKAVKKVRESRTHERVVSRASAHMGLGEHVTWLLGEATQEIEYPQRVKVTIEVEEVEGEDIE